MWKIGLVKYKKIGLTLVPILFVWLWSTGFIGAKFGLPYAEPFTFLFTRMLITLILFMVIILFTKSAWPSDKTSIFHLMVSGTLIQAAYLGGVFSAIHAGMPAGISSVIVGLQPIFTTGFTVVLAKTSFSRRQVVGLLLGFIGISCVLLGDSLIAGDDLTSGMSLESIIYCLIALFGISFGTFYQKRFCAHTPLLSGAFVHYAVTAIVTGVLAFSLETMKIDVTYQFILAMLWLDFGLSLTAVLLLLFMIKKGEVARVASLFYLVAPVTAIETYLFFDERINFITLIGIALSVFGVYLVLSLRGGLPWGGLPRGGLLSKIKPKTL